MKFNFLQLCGSANTTKMESGSVVVSLAISPGGVHILLAESAVLLGYRFRLFFLTPGVKEDDFSVDGCQKHYFIVFKWISYFFDYRVSQKKRGAFVGLWCHIEPLDHRHLNFSMQPKV